MKIIKHLEARGFRLEAIIESKDTITHSALQELSGNDLVLVRDDLHDVLDELIDKLKHKETKFDELD